MTSFSYYSATARTQKHDSGMFSAEYSGFFSSDAWVRIGQQVERERMGASVSMDLAYKATHDCSDHMESVDFSYLIGTPPGVWVVRPDQYDACSHIARRLAGMGVTRTVFLQSFELLALEFAEAAARRCPVSC